MNNEKYCTTVVAIAFCILVLTIGSCTGIDAYVTKIAIKEMVKGGADPIEARCSMSSVDSTVCGAAIARRTK